MKRVIFQEARQYSEQYRSAVHQQHRVAHCRSTAMQHSAARLQLGDCCWHAVCAAAPLSLHCDTALAAAPAMHAHAAPLCCAALAGTESSTHNYLLLGLALLQFPYGWWLSRLPI